MDRESCRNRTPLRAEVWCPTTVPKRATTSATITAGSSGALRKAEGGCSRVPLPKVFQSTAASGRKLRSRLQLPIWCPGIRIRQGLSSFTDLPVSLLSLTATRGAAARVERGFGTRSSRYTARRSGLLRGPLRHELLSEGGHEIQLDTGHGRRPRFGDYPSSARGLLDHGLLLALVIIYRLV